MSELPMLATILIAGITGVASAAGFWFWASRTKSVSPVKSTTPTEYARLHSLIDATVGTTGEPFFYAMVRELAYFLSIDSILIASIEKDDDQFQSLAMWQEGGYQMNRLISLESHKDVNPMSFWCVERGACHLFPQAEHLHHPFPAEGYFIHKLTRLIG